MQFEAPSQIPTRVSSQFETGSTKAFLQACETQALEKFKFSELRNFQKEALTFIDKHSYVLATLPTGAGKTLLYALPAAVNSAGKVLVVCPLVALMRDQALRLKEAQLNAAALHSHLEENVKRNVLARFLLPSENPDSLQILLVSPERLQMNSFLNALQKLKATQSLEMIVVDEAHCVLNWGHSFRVEYGFLSSVFESLAPKKILALTATLGKKNREALKEKIFPPSVCNTVADYCLPPLPNHIRVSSVRAFNETERAEQLFFALEKFCQSEDSILSPKIICYFNTRQSAADFATSLRSKKFKSVLYHAGLTKEDRLSCETYVKNVIGPVVVCATMAFGMGIDLPDVGLIVVHGFPSNIEEFFQMIGRAGRNLQPAQGILLWTGRDPVLRQYQFKNSYPKALSLEETLLKLSRKIPRAGEAVVCTGEDVAKSIVYENVSKGKSKNPSQSSEKFQLEGMVAALRFAGVLEDLPLDTRYEPVAIVEVKHTIARLASKLPPGVSVRSLFLQAVLKLYPESNNLLGAKLVLNFKPLSERSGLDYPKLLSVLRHYAELGDFDVSFLEANSESSIESTELALGGTGTRFLLRGLNGFKTALKNYSGLRQRFWEGLDVLQEFAESKECRMIAPNKYFGVSNGSIESVVSVATGRCGRCDVCSALSKKSKS